jgi:nicotinamidase-related amidase/alkylated DNA repair dioxygenase AlkB
VLQIDGRPRASPGYAILSASLSQRAMIDRMFATGVPGPKLTTKKALLLIDLQNDFVDEGGKLFVPNTIDFLPKLPHLVREFRAKGDVFFITTAYAAPRSIYSDATGGYGVVLKGNVGSQVPSSSTEGPDEDGSEQYPPTPPAEASHVITEGNFNKDVQAFLTPPYNSQTSWSQCCVPRSKGTSMPEILSSIVNPAVDTEVVKSHYSPFQDASFLLQLRMQLVTELYVCGSLSNISVYATVIDAVSHGMSVTIIEDCVGYLDESCHREAMRQMADGLGANGIDYAELLDDLAGLLGDIVHEEDFQTHYEVSFQHGLQRRDKPAPKHKASSWSSSLEVSKPKKRESKTSPKSALLPRKIPADEESRSDIQDMEPPPELGSRKQQTPSPPRKRQSDDAEPEVRDSKLNGRRRASHEGHIEESYVVKPSQVRRRKPRVRDRRRSPTPLQEVRPHFESRSTGDIPRTATAEPMMSAPTPQKGISKEPKVEDTATMPTATSSPRQEEVPAQLLQKQDTAPLQALGPTPTIALDSFILHDILPSPLSSTIFSALDSEITWQKMYHRSGEVPRLVAVQGEYSPTKIPIYRHPADASPPLLPFTPTVQLVRAAAEKAVGHELNHVLIQLYRGPEDSISEHADKTLDIVRGSKIVNYSAGALRTMVLRSKKVAMSTLDTEIGQLGFAADGEEPKQREMRPGPPRQTLRVPLTHNSLFVLGPETNQAFLHAIRPDRRLASERSEEETSNDGRRISLTFRHVGTFVDPENGTIWGQGATGKTKEEARRIVAGDEGLEREREYERMIRAFGQENRRGKSWCWEEWYGKGVDVVDGPSEQVVEGKTDEV